MNKVIRHMIADYLNVGTKEAEEYAFMNAGFTTLDENPSAKVETVPYVGDKSASGSITGYETVFPFETQLISDEAAVSFIYNIARNQKTGEDAETDYVRIDEFGTGVNTGTTSYPARKFRVAVEVTNIAGEGTQIVKLSGNLHQVGDFVDGTFDTSTKKFTPKTA